MRARLGKPRNHRPRRTSLYQDYGPGAYSLPDQGYIARVHPLELWLLGYLIENPQATFSDAVAASRDERQEVYGWLFKTRHRAPATAASAPWSRSRRSSISSSAGPSAWAIPFEHLVPSLATALGSSGDRPAALAELMGIIQNDGLRLPTRAHRHVSTSPSTPPTRPVWPASSRAASG